MTAAALSLPSEAPLRVLAAGRKFNTSVRGRPLACAHCERTFLVSHTEQRVSGRFQGSSASFSITSRFLEGDSVSGCRQFLNHS